MSKLSSITLFACAALLATGCYCPTLSGRFHGSACLPAASGPWCGCGGDTRCPPGYACESGGACEPAVVHGFAGGRGRHGNGPVPSNQGADYISPLPKFHPVPTRPVFEPVAAYPAPVPLESPLSTHHVR